MRTANHAGAADSSADRSPQTNANGSRRGPVFSHGGSGGGRRAAWGRAQLAGAFEFLKALLTDRRPMIRERAIIAISFVLFILYNHSRYQLIPPTVPVVGFLDNLAILVIGFTTAWRFSPVAFGFAGYAKPNIRAVARARARGGSAREVAPARATASTKSESLFLIAGNARSGSTWLETSLGDLPGVFTDLEFVWRPSFAPQFVHYVIEDEGASFRRALLELSPDARVIGSKFVADPHRLYPIGREHELLDALDADIRVIHLTRSYFDMLLSGCARGFVHERNPAAERPAPNSRMMDLIAESTSASPRRVELDEADIAVRLLTMFLNDLLIIDMTRRVRQWTHVSYRDIVPNLHRLGEFIGAPEDGAALTTAIWHPRTRKLAPLDPSLLPKHHAVSDLAAYLDGVRDLAILNHLPASEIFDPAMASIRVDGMAQRFDAYVGRPGALTRALKRALHLAARPRRHWRTEALKAAAKNPSIH